MKARSLWQSIVALIIMTCLLVLPTTALAKKGKSHFNRGMEYERAQQWDKAAQEFTLAVAEDPRNTDYQLHYRRAIFNASRLGVRDYFEILSPENARIAFANNAMMLGMLDHYLEERGEA